MFENGKMLVSDSRVPYPNFLRLMRSLHFIGFFTKTFNIEDHKHSAYLLSLPPPHTPHKTPHANMSEQNKKIIALFDVDGTLTIPRGEVKPEVNDFLAELRQKIVIGTVGGSDFVKQKEQLGEDVQSRFDYCFAENGLTALFGEETLGSQSFREYLGEDKLRELINFLLGYLAKLVDVPVKRGTVRC